MELPVEFCSAGFAAAVSVVAAFGPGAAFVPVAAAAFVPAAASVPAAAFVPVAAAAVLAPQSGAGCSMGQFWWLTASQSEELWAEDQALLNDEMKTMTLETRV